MARKRTTDTVRIDGEKLKQAIADHNLLGTELSEKIGYAKGYLSRFTSGAITGMPTRVATLLDLCGIHLDSYKYEEPEVPAEEPEDDPLPWDVSTSGDVKTVTVKFDDEQIEAIFARLEDMLNRIVRSAVYDETKKAWEEL